MQNRINRLKNDQPNAIQITIHIKMMESGRLKMVLSNGKTVVQVSA